MRLLISSLRLSARQLFRRRGRAFVMMAGIAAGLALLITLNAVASAARRATLAQVRNMLGTFDTVLVRPGGAKTRGMVSLTNVPPTLSFDDAAAIAVLPSIARVAELQNAFDVDAQAGDRDHTPAVFGVSENWLALRGDAMARGVFFTPAQVRSEARVAVLGADVIQALYPQSDPLGQRLRLGGEVFLVQGVLARRGAGPGGFSLDDLVLIPVTTASRRLFHRDFLTMAVAQIRPGASPASALAQIRSLLRQRHHLPANALDDFSLTDPGAVAAQLTSIRSRLEWILLGAAVAALALGAIAIVSLMSLAVHERRIEIAIRRAVGASRAAIALQFLAETLALTLAAAAGGLALGALGIAAAARWQVTTPIWSLPGMATAACAVIALGMACGLVPAWRAARLAPADGLRQ